MPRGTSYSEELREEARRLRREGWSLNEISAKLGPPKNTLTLWVRGIELTPEQRQRLFEKEQRTLGNNRARAAAAQRQGRLARIASAHQQAQAFLDTTANPQATNLVAAAMLYLAEGAKTEGAFSLGNSNPQIIRYWLYLLRTSFTIDETKFRLQIMHRSDQDLEELKRFWTMVTGIERFHSTQPDARTEGKPTKRLDYQGVCVIYYHDVALRRYLDAVAHGLMERAVGATPAPHTPQG